MALPSYTVTGSLATTLTVNANYAVQLTTLPPVHQAFAQTLASSPISALSYTDGNAKAQANKIVLASGSIASNTAAASRLDLKLALDISGMAAAGLTYIRELWVFNDGTSPFSSDGEEYIIWDFSVANSWGPGATTTGPIEGTGPIIKVQNGTFVRIAKPYGATGWAVGATTKLVCLGTPVQATVYYRIIALGDSH